MNQNMPYDCYTIPFWHLVSHENSFIFIWNTPDGICPAWLKPTLRAQFRSKNFTGENIWSHGYVSPTWCFSSSNPDRVLFFFWWFSILIIGARKGCVLCRFTKTVNSLFMLMAAKHIKKTSLLWTKVNQSGDVTQGIWTRSTWVKADSVVFTCNPSASVRGWKLRSHQAWHTHIKIQNSCDR